MTMQMKNKANTGLFILWMRMKEICLSQDSKKHGNFYFKYDFLILYWKSARKVKKNVHDEFFCHIFVCIELIK